jgi:hypothetical protein
MAGDEAVKNGTKFREDSIARAMLGENANVGTMLMLMWAAIGVLVMGGFFAWLFS